MSVCACTSPLCATPSAPPDITASDGAILPPNCPPSGSVCDDGRAHQETFTMSTILGAGGGVVQADLALGGKWAVRPSSTTYRNGAGATPRTRVSRSASLKTQRFNKSLRTSSHEECCTRGRFFGLLRDVTENRQCRASSSQNEEASSYSDRSPLVAADAGQLLCHELA